MRLILKSKIVLLALLSFISILTLVLTELNFSTNRAEALSELTCDARGYSFGNDADGDEFSDRTECLDHAPSISVVDDYVNDCDLPFSRCGGKIDVCAWNGLGDPSGPSGGAILWIIQLWPDQTAGAGSPGSGTGDPGDFGSLYYTLPMSYCTGGPGPSTPPSIECTTVGTSISYEWSNAPSGADITWSSGGGRNDVSPSGTGTIGPFSISNPVTITFTITGSTGSDSDDCLIDPGNPDPGDPGGGPSTGVSVSCSNPALNQYTLSGTANPSPFWNFNIPSGTPSSQTGVSTSVSFTFSATPGASWTFADGNGTVSGTISASCDEPEPEPLDMCPSFPGFQDDSDTCILLRCDPLDVVNGSVKLRILFESIPNHRYYLFSNQYNNGWAQGVSGGITYNTNADPQERAWGLGANRQDQTNISAATKNAIILGAMRQIRTPSGQPNWPWNSTSISTTNYGFWSTSTRTTNRYDVTVVPQAGGQFSESFIDATRLAQLQAQFPPYWVFVWGYPGGGFWYNPVQITHTHNVVQTAPRKWVGTWGTNSIRFLFPPSGWPYSVPPDPHHGKGIRIHYQSTDGTDSGTYDYVAKSLGQGYVHNPRNIDVENLANPGLNLPYGNRVYSSLNVLIGAYTHDREIDIPGLISGKQYRFTATYIGSGGIAGGINNPVLQHGDLVRAANHNSPPTYNDFDGSKDCGFVENPEGDVVCRPALATENSIRIAAKWNNTLSGVDIHYRKSGTTSGWSYLRTVPEVRNPNWASRNGYTVDGLEPNTRYDIRIRDRSTNSNIFVLNNSANCETAISMFNLELPAPIVGTSVVQPGQTLNAVHVVNNIGVGDAPAIIDIVMNAQLEGSEFRRHEANNQAITAGSTFSESNAYTIPATAVLGDEVCFRTYVNHATGNSDGTGLGPSLWSAPTCIKVGEYPYFDVAGGDVWAGAEFTTSNTCSANHDAEIKAPTASNIHTGGKVGAGSELGATALGPIFTFGTGNEVFDLGANRGDSLSFANTPTHGDFSNQPKCVDDYFAALSTHPDNFNITRTDNFRAHNNSSSHAPDNRQSFKSGDLNFGSSSGYIGHKTIVVDGDVTLRGNIAFASTFGNSRDDIPSLIIVASGDINIASTVRQVDAILIANGDVNTCTDPNGRVPDQLSDVTAGLAGSSGTINCSLQLDIFGAVHANRVNFQRTHKSVTTTNPAPAESIKYTPEVILAEHILNSNQFVDDLLKTQLLRDLPPVF